MMSTTDRWKHKYLNLIDDHEKLEERFEDQTAQLRRALIRLTVVAEGRDEDLDGYLEETRALLRKEQIIGLTNVLDRIEQVFERWYSNQEIIKDTLAKSLIDIETKYDSLPSTLTKMVKKVRKDVRNTDKAELLMALSQVITQWAEAMADQIEQAPEGSGKSSWFGRLFSKEEDEAKRVFESEKISSVGNKPYEIDQNPNKYEGLDNLSSEAGKVLSSLINKLSLPDPEQPRAAQLLLKINAGLNWYELVPALEILSDLVVSALGTEQEEFEAFLKTLNARLNALQKWLLQGENLENKFSSASKDFDKKMRGHLDELKDVLTSSDTKASKGSISNQLDDVFVTLDTFKLDQRSREVEFQQHIKDMGNRLEDMKRELEEAKEQLNTSQLVAMTDSLTQLPNRGAYDLYVAKEYERYRRYGGGLSLLVCDVDKFKEINDNYGHQAGDKVLQLISRQVKKGTRDTDFLSRYGGEEFVVILPESDAKAALLVGEKIRQQVAKSPFHFKGKRVQITISCGIACFKPMYRIEQVFDAADKALYKAKENGRNQCQIGELEGSPGESEPE
ncbi:MAG: diguanylate cyclase [Crocinitomicaceae bacterium]|jgi:diguanylate cyclase